MQMAPVRSVPLAPAAHFWVALPSHAARTSGVPSVPAPPLRHLPVPGFTSAVGAPPAPGLAGAVVLAGFEAAGPWLWEAWATGAEGECDGEPFSVSTRAPPTRQATTTVAAAIHQPVNRRSRGPLSPAAPPTGSVSASSWAGASMAESSRRITGSSSRPVSTTPAESMVNRHRGWSTRPTTTTDQGPADCRPAGR